MPDDQSAPRGPGAGRSNLVRYVPAAIVVVVLLAFVIDNRRNVTVGFVFTDARVPLIFVLLATLIIGALLGSLVRWRRR